MERKRKHRKKYLIPAAVIAILVGFVYCQNNLIQISHYTYQSAKIKSDKKISPDNLSILLAHEPQLFDAYVEADVDLVFSGHAHGGQFRMPFGNIGFVAPGQGFLPKYTAGEYKQDNTTMYVSRGLGNSIIPVRIFNQPELVVVELVK